MLTRPTARTTGKTTTLSAGKLSWFGMLSKRLGLPSPFVTTVRRESGLSTVMDDGVVLLADHWVPEGIVDPPLLLVRSPYGRGGVQGFLNARVFAHQGFQVIMQSCRGTDGSGGDFNQPMLHEKADGTATVRWLQEQSFFPGGFGTIGASYLGYTQLALAEAAGDALKAMVLQVAALSPRDVAWQHDALAWNATFTWALQANRGASAVVKNALALRSTEKKVRAVGMQAPLNTAYVAAAKGRIPFLEAWLDSSQADDPYWASVDQRQALEVITCPVLVQGGWYDLLLASSLEQYERLHERGVPVEMTIGPWTHVGFGTRGMGQTLTDAAAFLRDVLGKQPRTASLAPVRLTEIGSAHPVNLPAWPPEVEQLSFALVGGGRLAAIGDSSAPAQTRFTYDPYDPTPQAGGPTLELKAGPTDNSALERRADVVCFDTPPLEQDWHLLGPTRITLTMGSDRPSTQVFLRVCEVTVGGASTNLTDRIVPLHADERTSEGTWTVCCELPPTCARIASGSRLRLQISSGAFPRFARHSGTDEDPASALTFEVAHQVIHHSPTSPSTIVFSLASTNDLSPVRGS
jgi:putative CocE/NonD family hydrolase